MKIGITYTGSEEKQSNYINWLNQAGGCELITLFADEHADIKLDPFAGLVFTGGIDVHPSYYTMDTRYPNAPEVFNQRRDEFEKNLFMQSIQLGIPVLGICRGMQLINVLLGGTLKQDLGETGNDIHRAVEADKQHSARVIPDTLLHELIHDGAVRINSAHHQAIDKLSDQLMVNCLSDEGQIEGAEWRNKDQRNFLLCVQWHPERMFKFNLQNEAAAVEVRSRFLQEVKIYDSKHENH